MGPFRSQTARFCLEELNKNENAKVIICSSLLNGLRSVTETYDVTGLTRTSLDLKMRSKIVSYCRVDVRYRGVQDRYDYNDDNRDIDNNIGEGGRGSGGAATSGAPPSRRESLSFLYLDNDLCVVCTDPAATANAAGGEVGVGRRRGGQQELRVYAKSYDDKDDDGGMKKNQGPVRFTFYISAIRRFRIVFSCNVEV